MSPALDCYMTMVRELLLLQDDTPEQEILLDRMDAVYYTLTEAEIEEAGHLSDALTGGEYAKAHPIPGDS